MGGDKVEHWVLVICQIELALDVEVSSDLVGGDKLEHWVLVICQGSRSAREVVATQTRELQGSASDSSFFTTIRACLPATRTLPIYLYTITHITK